MASTAEDLKKEIPGMKFNLGQETGDPGYMASRRKRGALVRVKRLKE